MDKPIPAYKGSASFVFVCYAHSDAEVVYADLGQLNSEGVNIWYDEGIQAGSSWRAEIAAAITGASRFLFFVSEASLTSAHCLREVDYALNHDIEIIPVYLDDSALPPELDLALNRVQALFRKPDSRYMEHLLEALRKGPQLATLVKQKKRGGLRFLLPTLVLVLCALLGYTWLQNTSGFGSGESSAGVTAQPSAFDFYLEGMELMERWDKGDNLDDAIARYRLAIEADPGFALAYARLAEALRFQYALTRDKTKLDQGVESVNQAIQIDANLAPVQVSLGRIRATQGNMDLAFDALKRAISIDPNDATANAAIARLYERLGRLEDADAAFQKSVALDPENLLNIDSYANYLYRRGRYEDAVEQWTSVVRMAPDHYSALINLGSTLNEMGKVAEAISLYNRAIEVRPSYMAYSNLGTANSHAERYQDAVDAYLMALEFNDSDWLVWGNLAFVYSWMNGMDEQAIETFEHAIQLAETARGENSRDPYVNSDLGLYYAKLGQRDLALQRASTSVSLSPESGEIVAAAAEAHELIGEREKAIALMQQSVELGYPARNYHHNPELKALLAEAEI
ncbi:MAG: tetratricopeptide repeat protein [Halioglobus sp.]